MVHEDLPANDFALIFIELGAAIVGLAVLARVASRWGISSIPLYLLAGLAFGNGGIVPLQLTKGFIQIGAEVGVLLLLFMLGLEYSGEQLKRNLRRDLPAGAIDALLNFPPGFIAGLLLGWKPLPALLLGGITFISSRASSLGCLPNSEVSIPLRHPPCSPFWCSKILSWRFIFRL